MLFNEARNPMEAFASETFLSLACACWRGILCGGLGFRVQGESPDRTCEEPEELGPLPILCGFVSRSHNPCSFHFLFRCPYTNPIVVSIFFFHCQYITPTVVSIFFSIIPIDVGPGLSWWLLSSGYEASKLRVTVGHPLYIYIYTDIYIYIYAEGYLGIWVRV